MDNKDFFWLVGLLEGEGSFHWHKKSDAPSIRAQMKDKDVVERIALLLGAKVYGPYQVPNKPHWNPTYAVQVYGTKAIGWMEKLKPFMGIRRTAQIQQCLSDWDVRVKMSPVERMANARKFRFATEEQHLAQREQALKIKLGTAVRPN